MAGAFGAGICICRDRERRIAALLTFQRAFFWMAGEISYSRICLPEVLMEVGTRLRGGCGSGRRAPKEAPEGKDFGLGSALVRIGKRLEDGSGQDVQKVWQEEMTGLLAHTGLKERERELVLSFPEAVGFADGARQKEAVAEFAQSMHREAAAAQKQRKEEDKITMAFCAACGLTAVILLL